MAACPYTCDGCDREVPWTMWEDDEYWTTDGSDFYCDGCWAEWTTKQGSLVLGAGASAGATKVSGSTSRSSSRSSTSRSSTGLAQASTFASVFASAPAYDRMDAGESDVLARLASRQVPGQGDL